MPTVLRPVVSRVLSKVFSHVCSPFGGGLCVCERTDTTRDRVQGRHMAKKKIRVELRKNLAKPPRDKRWTQGFQDHGFEDEATTQDERVRAKGALSRKRTIIQDQST